MEKKLKALFDFQKFQNNKRLAELITEAENSVSRVLSDDELGFVSAAGEPQISVKEDTAHGN